MVLRRRRIKRISNRTARKENGGWKEARRHGSQGCDKVKSTNYPVSEEKQNRVVVAGAAGAAARQRSGDDDDDEEAGRGRS